MPDQNNPAATPYSHQGSSDRLDARIWVTGPGGVLLFSAADEHLGTLKTGVATANCVFNADKSVSYLTANSFLWRLKLR